jgi:hypothetical protein
MRLAIGVVSNIFGYGAGMESALEVFGLDEACQE